MSVLLRLWKWLGRWPWAQQAILFFIVPKFLIGVVAVLLDRQGRVVLFHHTYRRNHAWSLPGGWLKRGEEPADALVREIREEADLEIRIERPLAALAGAVRPNFEVIYLARIVGGVFRPSDEVDAMETFGSDNLPDVKPYQRALIEQALAESAVNAAV